MDSDLIEALVEKKGNDYLASLSLKYGRFYKLHTALVKEVKCQVKGIDLSKILEIEEHFNDHLNNCAEAYKAGMRDGLKKRA